LVHSRAFSFSFFPLWFTNIRTQAWIAVRKENKPLMATFFVVTTLFIASLSAMFGSDAYRLIFAKWPLFGALSVASFFGLAFSLGLSVYCRMRFGQGLASQRTWSFRLKHRPWRLTHFLLA
jgi:hypothetical protein